MTPEALADRSILVTPAGLRRSARIVSRQAHDVRQLQAELGREAELLRTAWQGPGRAAFEVNLRGLCRLMEQEIALLESMSIELIEAAERYEASDRSGGPDLRS